MTQPNQIAAERMFLNADKSAVLAEGHKDAAFLYAGKGDEIPHSACERFGIKDGKVPAKGRVKATGETKGKEPPANKGGKAPANKGGGKVGDKGKPAGGAKPAALTDIKGIGAVTAGALVTAGVADVEALAKVDPENPPTVETLPPGFDWAEVVAAAKGGTE